MSADDLLSVFDVMERYGLRDRRDARRLMDEIGALLIATNLYVRRQDLLAYEERLIAARARQGVAAPKRGVSNRGMAAKPQGERLSPGWWREAS
jgi:hypothetical protein